MRLPVRETIFALSSGALPSGVAIVRVSGATASTICQELAGDLPKPRQAALRSIRSRNGLMLDQALVLWFPAPHSFTGEDCLELHLHGGRALVRVVLEELASFDNCRMAEAGEFSRRGFEHGKLDLVEIEGLSDLLAADTEMQRRLAVEQSAGHLSAIYETWRGKLIDARALIEAELDFSDEGDIPGAVSDRIWGDMRAFLAELEKALDDLNTGEIIRDGFKVVIAGRPNSGKSSLLNALAGRDVAIVTEYEGTTRDILHCELDIGGYAVHFYDTAGIRETSEPVEREGIRRALGKMEEADLVLSLADSTSPEDFVDVPDGLDVIQVGTKADLLTDSDTKPMVDILISSATGYGIADLKAYVLSRVEDKVGTFSLAIPSRLRHGQQLRDAIEEVQQAIGRNDLGLEIRAEHLRRASDALGRITGRIDVEMLLGKIFSEFCVGK
ncbi:MAG: tRNA uridine-5-carboxymethylaminomethyl(34) synthesis GTPase MnmE [Hydrogenophaga sp.]|nr:tRNA uridine-5-carboxymethylaminomethyl(34) synthesis GTPase MnmE [Hydrogenophaga sp.]